MDLHLFGRVLWRFRLVVGFGCLIAAILSIFSISKVDVRNGMPHLVPRTHPVYATSASLMVTQSGFPWGSATQLYSSSGPHTSPVPAGDLSRLTALANLYVQLANSDVIRAAMARKAPSAGPISAAQKYAFSPSFYSTPMPILTITGTGPTPTRSRFTTQAGVEALTDYLRTQQGLAHIAPAQRVVLQELEQPRAAALINPAKKTIPVVVFLTVMLAVVGLAFVLENLRPRARISDSASLQPDAEHNVGTARRSA